MTDSRPRKRLTAPTEEELAEYRRQAEIAIAVSRRATWEDQKRKGNTAWLDLNPEPPALG